jgi:5-methylcytosine-specific restriction endonuclease McrA
MKTKDTTNVGGVLHYGASMAKKRKRNYRKEYDDFHGKPEQIKNRNKRNAARKLMQKLGLVKKGDGKHVDHIKPLSKGGSNGRKNLRVVSKKTNLKKGSKSRK